MAIEGMIENFIKETRQIKHLDKLRSLEHKLNVLITDPKIWQDVGIVFDKIYALNEQHDKSYIIKEK
jgi:hypothetical protein